MSKIEASSSGAIRVKSLQSLLSGSLSRNAISVDARGSPTALSSAWATAAEFGCAGALHERALRPFEHDGVWKINDLGFHEGTCGELILDRAESPAYPAIRGEECDLIADMEREATQTDKLERAGEAGMAIHCKQVVLARGEACDFDAQRAACVLGVVAIDRQRPRRVAWADDSAVHEVAAERTVSTEQPTRIDQRLRARN